MTNCPDGIKITLLADDCIEVLKHKVGNEFLIHLAECNLCAESLMLELRVSAAIETDSLPKLSAEARFPAVRIRPLSKVMRTTLISAA